MLTPLAHTYTFLLETQRFRKPQSFRDHDDDKHGREHPLRAYRNRIEQLMIDGGLT